MSVDTSIYQAPTAVFKFVRAERNQGTSYKKVPEGKAYDFGQLRVSDEHETFDVECKPQLADLMSNELTKGDFIQVFYEVGVSFGKTTYTVAGYNQVG